MSSQKEYLAADLRGPFNRKSAAPVVGAGTEIVVINSADTSSHAYDLQSSTYFNNDSYIGRFVRIISETGGDIWYYWSDVNTDTVDKTSTDNTAGTVSSYLPSAQFSDEEPAGRYLVMQTASAGKVRIWIANRTR